METASKSRFDYIIVGAGSAGCVLAHRLSADPSIRVLLIEAGGRGRSPIYKVPKFLFYTGQSRSQAWRYPVGPFGPNAQSEVWIRGKLLGGSSMVNGMMYNRGFEADYNTLRDRGNAGWDWETIVAAYRAIENHQLGASDIRGADGPLDVSVAQETEEASEAMIAAATRLGLARHADINSSDDERIGYAPRTIKNGIRVSSSTAFLRPVRSRPNLTVATGSLVTRVLFEGDAAVGVATSRGEHRASREVILCAGSIATPQLLQLSGIGPETVLREAGVDVRVHSPRVGEGMLEHRCFPLQARLRKDIGYNRLLSSAPRQALTGARYVLNRRGPLSTPAFDLLAFLRTLPDSPRPDAQLLLAPFSRGKPSQRLLVEDRPGITLLASVLRPTSQGSVRIASADPAMPPRIEPNYMATEHDRAIILAAFERMRAILRQSPLADIVESETVPGAAVESDEDIISTGFRYGGTGYHACASCAMGPDQDAAVDGRLRVRGVNGLRVMDASVMPTMISGNLNAPVMAMAWHAADLVLAGS